MYVDTVSNTVNGKTYTRHFLRRSYRDAGKVKKETVANLSSCSPDEIAAIKLALKNKKDLSVLGNLNNDVQVTQGLAFGAVWGIKQIADRLGISKALGATQEGKRALWQVIARVIKQGSRLSAVRLAGAHAACDVLDLDTFDEDDLYANLDWIDQQQAPIEDRLFKDRYKGHAPALYLYDVTSSYLEGTQNELADFGYQRDGKKGKRQIVYGMLCDEQGRPVSTQAFKGNTADTSTFGDQIKKVATRFNADQITFVGDRGMIKGPQIQQLHACQDPTFHYITAITRSQIETLLKHDVLSLGLFDETIAEVIDHDRHVRYVLRRNPVRAAEIAQTRADKLLSIRAFIQQRNVYLAEHPKALVDVAERAIESKISSMKVPELHWSVEGRTFAVSKQDEAWSDAAKLDGCYCLKTDLTSAQASAETVHDRYKDLAKVEWAFRTSKTSHLEVRPLYLRRATRTRGHLFVVMLAYLIVQELRRCWVSLEVTVEEGIDQLASLCLHEVQVKGKAVTNNVPRPRSSVADLLETAGVTLPRMVNTRGVRVSTRKKLVSERVNS